MSKESDPVKTSSSEVDKKSTKFNFVKNLFFLSVGFLLLFLVFKDYIYDDQKRSEILKGFYEIDFSWVILSIIFGLIAIVSRGLRWLILLDSLGYKSKKSNSIYSVAIGYLSNTVIPRSGELTRCTSLNQKENIPLNKLLGTVILERIIDLIILILLLAIGFIIKFNVFVEFFSSISEKSGESVMLKLFFWLAIVLLLFIFLFIFFGKKIKNLDVYIKIAGFFQGFKDGLTSIKKIKNKTAFWAHTFSIWLMYFLMTYICFFCISATANLSVADGIFIMVVGGLGMVFPSPGGIGSYHFLVIAGLSLLQVDRISADLFATTVHSAQTLMVLAFGLVSLLLLFISKKTSNDAS